MSYFKFTKYKLDLSRKTYVMGILNLTPDSFSDGGMWENPLTAVNRAIEIEAQGADILDIGAQSTKPGSNIICEDEEWNRLKNIIKTIRDKIKIPISIDTFYPNIAKKCIELGVDIINDITGFENDEMFNVARNCNCGLIINHNSKKLEIKSFFEKKLKKAENLGIDANRICFDPGIGFNKTQVQDAFIINNIDKIKLNRNALLIGLSRKRVIGAACGNPPPIERLSGTITANTLAVLRGANIIRVHDVKEAVQSLQVMDFILNKKTL